jgi:hypothetical protein
MTNDYSSSTVHTASPMTITPMAHASKRSSHRPTRVTSRRAKETAEAGIKKANEASDDEFIREYLQPR